MPDKIEYRVRPVTRYIVTRFERRGDGVNQAASRAIGEYDNAEMAYQVGYACAKTEHDRLGYPPGDERIAYPHRHDFEPKSTHQADHEQDEFATQAQIMNAAAKERARQTTSHAMAQQGGYELPASVRNARI